MREGGFAVITNFSSYFSQYLVEMMELKRNSGFSLGYMDTHVIEFDDFCNKSFPGKQHLDQELAESWIYDTNSESRSELNKRVRTMRHLANHLISLGISAYLCPIRIKIPKPSMPHIFTDEQLEELFRVCDSFESVAFPRYRHILFPTMFRVIYCCGLRNSEVCNLKHGDVNLKNGTIKVIGSKGHKDRAVYMAPDLVGLCGKYDAAMELLLPGREYFFPSQHHKHFINTSICRIFDEQILVKCSFYGKTSKKPTCHGLRHAFAVNSMRQCIANGDNFDAYIQYLCKYMGHSKPQETMYYLHMVVNIIPELRAKAKGLDDVIGGVFYAEE
jgi:site-specific recombinase XerD